MTDERQFQCPACRERYAAFKNAERCYRNHKGSTLSEKVREMLP